MFRATKSCGKRMWNWVGSVLFSVIVGVCEAGWKTEGLKLGWVGGKGGDRDVGMERGDRMLASRDVAEDTTFEKESIKLGSL